MALLLSGCIPGQGGPAATPGSRPSELVISTVAGSGAADFGGDGGPAASAQLRYPRGVTVDRRETLYVADAFNNRIRAITPAGVISTVAGGGASGFAGDGGPARQASLNLPRSLAVDGAGSVYIADLGNNRIRKVDPAGLISTVAGTGAPGFDGDGGPATSALLNGPAGVAVDVSGNLFIADTANHRIRKVTPAGSITTVAGAGFFGFSGDGGPATAARFDRPSGLAVDRGDNLYIADTGNNRIRRVTPAGVITTVAGNGTLGFAGEGGAATGASLNSPRGVALDERGTLFIADTGNNRVRKITPDGTIVTVTGTGETGFAGDGGLAAVAQLVRPYAVAVGPSGAVYVADTGNSRLRKLSLSSRPAVTSPTTRAPASPSPSAVPASGINVYAAATSGPLAPALAGIAERVYVPNEGAGTVVVIDPATFAVVDRFVVGKTPHHITPTWDLTRLLINNMDSDSLTEIDPRTGKPVGTIPVTVPYNLYYPPDGSKAIIVAEPLDRLDFYDRQSWRLLKSLPIPWEGINHLDMSADGKYLLASTEFEGFLVKVDLQTMTITGQLDVGGLPTDVRLAPDGTVFYVTNQGRHGVSIIDPVAMREVTFLPTGRGAHGLAVSRDARSLFVTNRLEGTITVIDFATQRIRTKWTIGGSPDMLQVSSDGRQLWTTSRFDSMVYVVDTMSGAVLSKVATDFGPHGLSYFPQPGRLSLGHNGVFR